MLTLLILGIVNTAETEFDNFLFGQLQDTQYMIVNDTVMGGRSHSELKIAEDTALYTGSVSLENNGGFASVRMVWPFDLSAHEAQPKVVKLTIKGDGKRHQFRLRSTRGFDGAAYSYQFDTVAGQQQTIYMPIDQFVPTFRGRVLYGMPELSFLGVQQMSILVADYQSREFAIELLSVGL